jgi:uncharacterized protein
MGQPSGASPQHGALCKRFAGVIALAPFVWGLGFRSQTPPFADASMSARSSPFWKSQALAALTPGQWESLCDGCAKCCLRKIEDADTGVVYFTNLACRLLDLATCRCSRYAERTRWVPECVPVTLELLANPYWLPSSCAYRRLAEGRKLPHWHPLVCGDPQAVHRSGHSVYGKAVSEAEDDDWQRHLTDWVD